jgi:hypothetical protein
MGLLDWFRRPRTGRRLPDWVWLEQDAKFRGLAREAVARRDAGERVLVVAHFADTLVRAGAALGAAGFAFETRRTWRDEDTRALLAGPAALAALAGALPAGAAATATDAGAPPVAILAAELHMLAAHDARADTFAKGLPVRSTVRAFVALDDPILQPCVGDRIRALLGAMGLRGDTRIDSTMVTRALRDALAKAARKATGDVACESAAAWLQRNYQA